MDQSPSDGEPIETSLIPERHHDQTVEFDDLIRRARAGDGDALGQLLDGCRQYLLAIANKEITPDLGRKVGASDIVQETLLEAQAGIDQFSGENEAELIAWLRAILKHNLTDMIRGFVHTEKRQISREQRLTSGHDLASPQNEPTPSRLFAADEEAQRLYAAMARLPEDYRLVIELRNWELLSFKAIGEKLERTEEAARKLWARAIEKIHAELERHDG